MYRSEKLKYFTNRNGTQQRMINQEEIVYYFKHNPGRTENEMQEEVYRFFRNTSSCSNKKYADCLRRALYSGKLSRKEVMKGNRKMFIYFVSS